MSSGDEKKDFPEDEPNPSTVPDDEKGEDSLTSDVFDKEKARQIWLACETHDVESLIQLASSRGGLLTDQIRQEVWPILLGSSRSKNVSQSDWKALPKHSDEEQVALDVDRSFVYYPQQDSNKRLDDLRAQLSIIIVATLRQNPRLSYFQGYHDIAQVMLLALGPSLSQAALARVSLLRLRDFMLPSLGASLAHLRLLFPLLSTVDPVLVAHLRSTEQLHKRPQWRARVAPPFWALAATITLYAHDVTSYSQIARLFDFLLAREQVATVYLFAAIVLRRRDELMAIPSDEPDMLHFCLSKLPPKLEVEELVAHASRLLREQPPERLPDGAWGDVSRWSTLKTTLVAREVCEQRDDVARGWFERQSVELKRREMLEKAYINVSMAVVRHRKAIRGTGLAVVVGLLAWWLGKGRLSGNPQNLLSASARGVWNGLMFVFRMMSD